MRESAWALRESVSAYDALYLALAEELPESILMTNDAGLATNARRVIGDQRVRHPS